MPFMAMAQNNSQIASNQNDTKSETKVSKKAKKANKHEEDLAYLAGTVPEVDGKVVFSFDIDLPGKTAEEVYTIVLSQLTNLTKDEHQTGISQIAIADKEKLSIAATYQEWLTFKDTFLELDRTLMDYTIMANCTTGKCHMDIQRISYKYEIKRRPQYFTAEESITDHVALSKTNDKLMHAYYNKFRRKTVDRMNEIKDTLRKSILASAK